MFAIKKAQPTDFEMRNPEAYREYCKRETKKFVIKTIAGYIALGIVGAVVSVAIDRWDRSTPYAD